MSTGPHSLTDEEFRKREEELSDMSESTELPLYLTFPKINTNALVIDFKKTLEECNEYYAVQDGANEFIEVGPGNVLQGLVKKIDRGMNTKAATFEN